MSTRAFRRLHGEADIIRLRVTQDDEEESEGKDIPVVSQTQRKSKKKGCVQPVLNPFDMVSTALAFRFVSDCLFHDELLLIGGVAVG